MSEIVNLTAEEAAQKYPGSSEFVHLHNHTLFSLLDGVAQPADYFKGCAERKWPAFAITEHGVLSSIPDAYLAAKENKVKYIVGCEFYLNDFESYRKQLVASGIKIGELKVQDFELSQRVTRNRHLTVLAKNYIGYENILKINQIAWSEGFYYKPRIWFDLLAAHKEGLIVTSGCLNGPVCHELRKGNLVNKDYITGALTYVDMFKKVFGEDFYIELQMPGIEGDIEVFRKLMVIAENKKIKPVLCNDCHYISRKDYQLQKIMMAIDQDTTVDDPELFHVNSDEQYFKTRHELRATFFERGYSAVTTAEMFELACDTTLEIADKCQSFKPNLDPKLPKIDGSESRLRQLAEEGLKKYGFDRDTTQYVMDEKLLTYREQMNIELERIIEKGFASYFLITLDLINASINNGMQIGPGRGSVGGSLLSYLIGIQSLDPFKWGTSFNRFLSPSRGGYMLNVSLK
jgi:DNA polymerase-3 subunit alpha